MPPIFRLNCGPACYLFGLLFRWFVGLGIDDPVFIPTLLNKNRDRLQTTVMSRKVMAAILTHREVPPLLSESTISVDSTLVKVWTYTKSCQSKTEDMPPDGAGPENPSASDTALKSQPVETRTEMDPLSRTTHHHRKAEVHLRGKKQSYATHASTIDTDVRLYKESPDTGPMRCFMWRALMGSRIGLVVEGGPTQTDGDT